MNATHAKRRKLEVRRRALTGSRLVWWGIGENANIRKRGKPHEGTNGENQMVLSVLTL